MMHFEGRGVLLPPAASVNFHWYPGFANADKVASLLAKIGLENLFPSGLALLSSVRMRSSAVESRRRCSRSFCSE